MILTVPPGESPIICSSAKVLVNEQIAKDTFLIRVREPAIASRILPGQFVMLKISGRTDPLLARPYALYEVSEESEAFDIIYLIFGNGTRCLSTIGPGSSVDVWGPLGNTFPTPLAPENIAHLFLVAGGIGQTPFLAVIKELLGQKSYGASRKIARPRKITFAWGVRSADYLAALDDFQQTGVNVQIATDDGSAGRRGFVTDILEEAIDSSNPPTTVFGCGPEPMLEKLCSIVAQHNIPAWVSLETKMACGYGVCFSCVTGIREEDGWDYKRVCTEGPVFPADQIHWDIKDEG